MTDDHSRMRCDFFLSPVNLLCNFGNLCADWYASTQVNTGMNDSRTNQERPPFEFAKSTVPRDSLLWSGAESLGCQASKHSPGQTQRQSSPAGMSHLLSAVPV